MIRFSSSLTSIYQWNLFWIPNSVKECIQSLRIITDSSKAEDPVYFSVQNSIVVKIIIISILAVAMIGLMVPSVFAVTSDSSDVGTVNIQYNTFYQGDENLVKIFGDVNAYVQSKKLVVIITNPDGTTDGSQIFPTSDGYYETYHSIGSNAQLGSYKVFATYAAETIGTVYFEVLSEAEGEAIKAAEREADEREAAEREAAEREAIEAAKPKPILSFVDPEKDPSHYVNRYINEERSRKDCYLNNG